MMKFNKNHILLPSVVIIWTIIGYQFYNAVGGADVGYKAQPPNINTEKEIDTTSFDLVADYRDPFIGERKVFPKINRQVIIKPKITVNSGNGDATRMEWPKILYMGMIQNNHSKTRVALVSSGGKNMMLKEGEHIAEFTIHRIWKDSLQIKKADMVYTYKKKL